MAESNRGVILPIQKISMLEVLAPTVRKVNRKGSAPPAPALEKKVRFSIAEGNTPYVSAWQARPTRSTRLPSKPASPMKTLLNGELAVTRGGQYPPRFLPPKPAALARGLLKGDLTDADHVSPGDPFTEPEPSVQRLWRVDAIDPWDNPVGVNHTAGLGAASPSVRESKPTTAMTPNPSEAPHDCSWVLQIPPAENDTALQRARERNKDRLIRANQGDLELLGKYLPDDISFWFPFSVQGPVDVHEPPAEWLEEVLDVARTPGSVPMEPTVKFSCDKESLEHNTEMLRKCDWDLETFFNLQKDTTIDHGSEFRPREQLQRLVGKHPNYPFLKQMLEQGFQYFLSRELSEEERMEEFEAQFSRGNHKSVSQENEAIALSLLENDVKHGFALPIHAERLKHIKGVHLQPAGMVQQFSLNADGSRKRKNRSTHDLSFSITQKDASINERIDMSCYPDMVYGWCFSRIIHYLAALRHLNPRQRIYISKFDYSDAYKRISQSPGTCAATVVRFAEIAYIFLRMAFGGSPNPAAFSCFSETLTDVANELAMSRYHPSQGSSPTVKETHALIREVEEDNTEVAHAVLPALEVPVEGRSSNRDCFIDDIIDCHLGTAENLTRAPHLVQMAVHIMSRPHCGEKLEPVPRKPLLGPDKLEAEGRSSEVQIVLGWEIRTRTFEVRLPHDKYTAWVSDVQTLRRATSVLQSDLESLVGKLNHATSIIPLSRHFLNEIRTKSVSVPRNRRQRLRLTEEEKSDLELWESFLTTANNGISINLLVIRNPTRMAWSDSCPFGIGGYTLSGTAWRIRVPREAPYYGDDSVNNVLEFLGMAISVLLLLKEAKKSGEAFPCLLVLGDNTSAISWLFKSGRVSKSIYYYPTIKMIARHLARCVNESKAQLCSQHIAGEENQVADILSYEGSCRNKANTLTGDCPPNDVLTRRLHISHSQLIPNGFVILQLPAEIELFALSVMQTIAKSWSLKEKQRTKNEIGAGVVGKHSSGNGGLGMTPSSIRYPQTVKNYSWQEGLSCITEPSTSMDRARLLTSVRSQWYRRLYAMPLAMWLRRSGNVTGPAPSTSRTESIVHNRCTPGSSVC
jgi:hypothetical protein